MNERAKCGKRIRLNRVYSGIFSDQKKIGLWLFDIEADPGFKVNSRLFRSVKVKDRE